MHACLLRLAGRIHPFCCIPFAGSGDNNGLLARTTQEHAFKLCSRTHTALQMPSHSIIESNPQGSAKPGKACAGNVCVTLCGHEGSVVTRGGGQGAATPQGIVCEGPHSDLARLAVDVVRH